MKTGRVLVTGGEGFLGTHLVDRLRGKGYEPFKTPFREGLERTVAWYRSHVHAEA